MDYKLVNVNDAVQIPVPIGLTPDEEAQFIANRIGFVDFERLEAECREAMQLLKEGKLTNFEDILDELDPDHADANTNNP